MKAFGILLFTYLLLFSLMYFFPNLPPNSPRTIKLEEKEQITEPEDSLTLIYDKGFVTLLDTMNYTKIYFLDFSLHTYTYLATNHAKRQNSYRVYAEIYQYLLVMVDSYTSSSNLSLTLYDLTILNLQTGEFDVYTFTTPTTRQLRNDVRDQYFSPGYFLVFFNNNLITLVFQSGPEGYDFPVVTALNIHVVNIATGERSTQNVSISPDIDTDNRVYSWYGYQIGDENFISFILTDSQLVPKQLVTYNISDLSAISPQGQVTNEGFGKCTCEPVLLINSPELYYLETSQTSMSLYSKSRQIKWNPEVKELWFTPYAFDFHNNKLVIHTWMRTTNSNNADVTKTVFLFTDLNELTPKYYYLDTGLPAIDWIFWLKYVETGIYVYIFSGGLKRLYHFSYPEISIIDRLPNTSLPLLLLSTVIPSFYLYLSRKKNRHQKSDVLYPNNDN